MPYCANTHCVKPLQSKPVGSLPPLRYGVPRKLSAVAMSASEGSIARGTPGAAGVASGVDGNGAGAGVEAPAGVGNGRGRFAPLDAHADASAAAVSSAVAIV